MVNIYSVTTCRGVVTGMSSRRNREDRIGLIAAAVGMAIWLAIGVIMFWM